MTASAPTTGAIFKETFFTSSPTGSAWRCARQKRGARSHFERDRTAPRAIVGPRRCTGGVPRKMAPLTSRGARGLSAKWSARLSAKWGSPHIRDTSKWKGKKGMSSIAAIPTVDCGPGNTPWDKTPTAGRADLNERRCTWRHVYTLHGDRTHTTRSCTW